MTRKTIKVDVLARVEGEGGLRLVIDGNTLREAELKIFEPPRFFEAFLRGRNYTEVPDITARICGICPVAYQMSAVHAMEDALGITIGPEPEEPDRGVGLAVGRAADVQHLAQPLDLDGAVDAQVGTGAAGQRILERDVDRDGAAGRGGIST